MMTDAATGSGGAWRTAVWWWAVLPPLAIHFALSVVALGNAVVVEGSDSVRYAWEMEHLAGHVSSTGESLNPDFTPLYPALGSLLVRAGFESEIAARIVSLAASVVTFFAVSWFAWSARSARAVAVTGLLFAFSPALLELSVAVFTESLYLGAVWLGLWVYARSGLDAGWRQGALAGLLLGAAFLTRVEGLLFLVSLPVVHLARTVLQRRGRAALTQVLRWAAGYAVVFLLLAAPQIAWTSERLGSFAINGRQIWVALFNAGGGNERIYGLDHDPGKINLDVLREHPEIAATYRSEVSPVRTLRKIASNAVRRLPLRMAQLLGLPVLACSLVGLVVLVWRRDGSTLWMLGLLTFNLLPALAHTVAPRHLSLITPMLLILAASGMLTIGDALFSRARRAAPGLAVALAIVGVNLALAAPELRTLTLEPPQGNDDYVPAKIAELAAFLPARTSDGSIPRLMARKSYLARASGARIVHLPHADYAGLVRYARLNEVDFVFLQDNLDGTFPFRSEWGGRESDFDLLYRGEMGDSGVELYAMLPAQEAAPAAGVPVVPLFTPFELRLRAANDPVNPYLEMPGDAQGRSPVRATFTGPGDERVTVDGFWDGDRTWLVRFAPTAPGRWSYRTDSPDAGLDGVSGALDARASTAHEIAANPLRRGFLVADGFGWRLGDAGGFLPVGDTQWSLIEEFHLGELQGWIRALEHYGLNTILGNVWLGKYSRAGFAPFAGYEPATDALNVAYFRRLDELVAYANERGIVVGLTIGGFPRNTRWFERMKTRERNDRWFRYVLARYAAYNVRWVLYGEVNENDPPWGATWQEEVAHDTALIERNDPYGHPVGSHHNFFDESSAASPRTDFIEVQITEEDRMESAAQRLREYGKPVWYEEYWYEPSYYEHDLRSGLRSTHRNFVAAMVFPTFGSLMRAHEKHEDFVPAAAAERGLDVERYLVEHDPGLRGMGEFVSFYRGVDTLDFSPFSERCSAARCGRFGTEFLMFLEGGGTATIDLSDHSGSYAVEKLEIHGGSQAALETVAAGQARRIDSQAAEDCVLRLTPVR